MVEDKCLFAAPPVAVPPPSAYTYPSYAPSYPSQNVQYPSNNYQYSQNQQYQSNNYQYNRPQIPRASNPNQQTSSNNFQPNNNFNNFQSQPSQTFNSAPSPPLPAPPPPPPPPPIPEPPIAAIPPPVNEFQPILPPLIIPTTIPPTTIPPATTIPTTLPVIETTIAPEIPTPACSHKPEYPLPECYTNDEGFMCCSSALEHVMHETVEELKASRDGTWKSCNVQAISNKVQKKAEERFNLTFEVISGISDFASKSHFYMNNICKTHNDGRYILAYATAVPENRRKHAQYEQIVDEAIFDDQKSVDYETVQNDDKHFHTWKM
uniref:Ground-like domain-containing protein n=1 Tax=Acrobeloides nanus TaxID=290746 RepID=A0A914DPI8_9BILA